ncbi:FAD-binding oxidoreductase [Roseomonas sp. OT10]|uniref:NAD(P)/FAD-dependent oxidoreductase n=1 Tax=Roseomonas cutis TaxID=2897332 RepID=UPI001E527D7F|nr:FAD-binding oxidoreductase [Roseomonas sp. OT10]UFN48857.1 FAD-binding oxidoreductase [Roseomonas sp. OT10]
MAPQVDRFQGSEEIPARTSVVVIGGGIAGVSTALFLADRGVPVVLCEKGVIGGEQSSRNWGWTRVMGRDEREIPLGLESLKLWHRMNEMTRAETGFRECGIAYLCDTEKEVADYEAWQEKARPYQVHTQLLRGQDIDRVVPGAARPYVGALYNPGDGRAEPTKAAPAIAAGAAARGATILTGCAVRGIETKGGRVDAVVTERGRIACDSVVLAGGAWSRLFAGNAGIDLPQLKILGSVFRTGPVPGAPEVSAGSNHFGFRKRLDGGYTVSRRNASISVLTPDSFRLFADFAPTLVKSWRELRLRVGSQFLTEWNTPRRWRMDEQSPFERVRVLDPEPNAGLIDEAKRLLPAAFPAFKAMHEVERWGGLIDVTPDAVPVISAVDAIPGFFMATGFSGHGFGIGPGAGRLMADLVTGATPVVDAEPYRLSRFNRSQRLAA